MQYHEQTHQDKHNALKFHCFRTYPDGRIAYNQTGTQDHKNRWGREHFYRNWDFNLWAECPYWEYYQPVFTPETFKWGDVKQIMHEATARARVEAERHDFGGQVFPCGFVYWAQDAAGECVLYPADCWNVAKTKAQFLQDIALIKERYPTAATIGMECRYDWARSMYDYYKVGDYDPQVSYGDTGAVILLANESAHSARRV